MSDEANKPNEMAARVYGLISQAKLLRAPAKQFAEFKSKEALRVGDKAYDEMFGKSAELPMGINERIILAGFQVLIMESPTPHEREDFQRAQNKEFAVEGPKEVVADLKLREVPQTEREAWTLRLRSLGRENSTWKDVRRELEVHMQIAVDDAVRPGLTTEERQYNAGVAAGFMNAITAVAVLIEGSNNHG